MTRAVIIIVLICTLSRLCPAQGTNDTPKPLPTDYSNFDSLSDHDREMVVWRLFDKNEFGKPEHKPICRSLLATQGRFANANGTSWTLEAIALTEKHGWKDFTDLIQTIRQKPDNIWANQAALGCLRSFSGKPVPADIVKNAEILFQGGVWKSGITDEALTAAKRELVSSPDQEAVLVYSVTVAGWHSGKGGTDRGRTAAVEVIRAMPKEMVDAELAKLKGKNEVGWIVSHLGTNTQQAVLSGEFDFEVTRSYSHPPAARPGDGLDDKLYAVNTNGIQYKVEFSSDGSKVNINTPKSLTGTLASDSGNVRTYAVNSFTGGRFVVSATGTNCEAELTIYGSGVPIISSVRGHLVRSGCATQLTPQTGEKEHAFLSRDTLLQKVNAAAELFAKQRGHDLSDYDISAPCELIEGGCQILEVTYTLKAKPDGRGLFSVWVDKETGETWFFSRHGSEN